MKTTKTLTKIISIIIIVMTLLCSMSTLVFADDEPTTGGGSSKISTESFDPSKYKTSEENTKTAVDKANAVITLIRVIGIVVAVAGLIAIGIKFMVGSVEERADFKKAMIPYVVGCVLIFTITQILSTIYEMVSSVE